MPLAKAWRSLDRNAVGKAPNRYGVYEIGRDGEVLNVGHGVLRDELKSALSYADGDQVRWEETHTEDRARELAAEHRERLE